MCAKVTRLAPSWINAVEWGWISKIFLDFAP